MFLKVESLSELLELPVVSEGCFALERVGILPLLGMEVASALSVSFLREIRWNADEDGIEEDSLNLSGEKVTHEYDDCDPGVGRTYVINRSGYLLLQVLSL